MSLLFAAALAASATTLPVCTWDRPGVNPYMGNVVTAVDRYSDIPEPVRAALKARMAARQYDDIAVIRRDSIAGRHAYGAEIRDMHFGEGQVCRTVTRSGWTPATEERGLVYCESKHCIIVPTVCRNVSRVTRLAPAGAAGHVPGDGDGPAGGGTALRAGTGPGALPSTAGDELVFDAPGAGPSFAQQADSAQPGPAILAASRPAGADGSFAPDDAGYGFGGGPVGGSPNANAPGGADGTITAGPVGTPAAAGPWPPGGDIGSGRRPGGSGFPFDPEFDPEFDPGTLVLPPAPPPVLAVPEPGTWAMWLLGLATLGGAARRRRPVSS